jgi:hypothetical protein
MLDLDLPPPLVPPMPPWNEREPTPAMKASGCRVFQNVRHRLTAISQTMQEDDGSVSYYVSATRFGRRCTDAQLDIVRTAFGMQVPEHIPPHGGNARHLFMPVAED